ncbi:HAMP domain-containing histidine kinase [Antarcticibacterium arcticum]|uniref:histidine kinase n=1 Tax=Antarcticibacterium arcticum TaxID=2585771 RepID=A0A5B8YH31_9FLAO|nr:HAMP domain-containing sensor histidine kinase [Antarcticibacterium arcticum]QED36891.1 HAMP domain-containing histidine kinase [Antarcticibacterium arcticum]
MKLLNLTTLYLAGLLFLLLTLWAVIFYFQMLDEIYDSLDDGLENQKILIMEQAGMDPSILDRPAFNEGAYIIQKVEFNQFKNFRESYRDTLMYMQNEEDFEPVRLLESVFKQDDSYYKIKVITSMVEEDDLVKELLISLLLLYLGLIGSILIMNNLLLKKIWNPFYVLLAQLRTVKIQDKKKAEFITSRVEEFQYLGLEMKKFIDQAQERYHNQKEFIENSSHEMQTPLAIAINNLEELTETPGLKKAQVDLIAKTLNKLESLTRFNKSLLLLSKIKNQQFLEFESINFNELIKNVIEDFKDIAQHRNVEIVLIEQGEVKIEMNKELAEILFTNLLKNAIIYNGTNETVTIQVLANSVNISNTSNFALDKEKLFNRFGNFNASSSSNGLGLAIVKAIADIYSFRVDYKFEERLHTFSINF